MQGGLTAAFEFPSASQTPFIIQLRSAPDLADHISVQHVAGVEFWSKEGGNR
jgi:hypothetical protein